MISTSDSNSTASGTVVAYFASGQDAQSAINELVDEGFPVDEIGAAFHSRGASGATSETGTISPTRHRHDEMNQVGSVASGAGTSGAESGTSGVTPAGLATGAGTGFTGAPRPGPIPGSEIPSYIPSELPSGIASSNTPRTVEEERLKHDASYANLSASPAPSGTGWTGTEPRAGESWWDKLKDVFSGKTHGKREPQSDKGAANFGTGEGQLGLVEYEAVEYDYPYSGSAFESSFSSMGIPASHARRLSNIIRGGGAIVTVNAESRLAEAEKILERNHGQIREESGLPVPGEASLASSEPSRVAVFGRVQRVYPGYFASDQPTRKAS
ncbi:MAG TPA: hypothetical protein VMB19_00495 [Silvibacterium sp.]|nr:hypothetical protein [Silvibacterium sp.]